MLVTLEAVSGPIAGRRIEIRAGTILRIGRTAKSDYALSEDSYLSGQHFAIENDGNEARARDLGSSNGTFVNGERVVSENVLREGDSLTAGGSTFTVHIDSIAQQSKESPSRVSTLPTDSFPGTSRINRAELGLGSESSSWPGFTRAQSVLLTSLYRGGETVFAVLDPLRDARIPAFLDASGEQFFALDDGIRVAAYVVVRVIRHGKPADIVAPTSGEAQAKLKSAKETPGIEGLIKGRLKTLAGQIKARAGAEVKVFVDTAPLMEKPLAEAAGLGWQGKHTNLVSREFGSWLFLGSILTDAALTPDPAEEDHCGQCRACLDICPTKAFPAPYQLDARRCISYLTIEHPGAVPEDLRPLLGNRIYGCDDCLAVCPWNKFAEAGRETKLAARAALVSPPLVALAMLDDNAFRALFAKSPIKRIGRDRFVRNVLYAIGNSADPSLAEAARARLDDPSPIVRDAAAWALGRLQPGSVKASNSRAMKAAPRSI